LLAVVAWQQRELPEYRLSLPKLLCGLEVWDPVLTEPLLHAEQIAECERLLLAAIVHVPALSTMTPDAFRRMFVARRGVLGVRDGLHLLQIEQGPYDALLERLPWSWGWIQLPWMTQPLQVEW
jgi:hypothetical protein